MCCLLFAKRYWLLAIGYWLWVMGIWQCAIVCWLLAFGYPLLVVRVACSTRLNVGPSIERRPTGKQEGSGAPGPPTFVWLPRLRICQINKRCPALEFDLAFGPWLLALGYLILAAGFWFLFSGCWLLVVGYGKLVIGFWLLAIGSWL